MPYHGIDPLLPKSFSLVRKWSVVRGYICSCNSKGEKGEEEQQGSIALVESESRWDREVYGELLPKHCCLRGEKIILGLIDISIA